MFDKNMFLLQNDLKINLFQCRSRNIHLCDIFKICFLQFSNYQFHEIISIIACKTIGSSFNRPLIIQVDSSWNTIDIHNVVVQIVQCTS